MLPLSGLYDVEWMKYYPDICSEGPRKTAETSVRMCAVPGEIRAEHLPNMSKKFYRYDSPLLTESSSQAFVKRILTRYKYLRHDQCNSSHNSLAFHYQAQILWLEKSHGLSTLCVTGKWEWRTHV